MNREDSILNEYSLDEYDFEILELQWTTAAYPIPIEGGPGGVCDAVCDFVSDTVDSACDFVSSSFDNAFDFISDSFDIVYNMLSDPYSLLTDPFGSAYDLFTETWDSFTDFCEDTWEDIEEFAEETWDSVCDAWDKFGQQLVMIAAVVVTSWIPGVNAVVAGAVIGALSAGLESGWDLKAMAVGAAAGAISSYAGGLGNSAAKLACNAGSSALKAGYESGWDLSEMGEAAVTGAATSYISGKFKANGWDSTTAGRFARNTTVSTINSCQRNGWNSDAVVNGVAGGVGNMVGEMAVGELDIDNPEAQKFVYSTVSSTTSQALVAAATGEDVMDAVTNGVARNAVTASLNTLTNQLYDEFPEGEAYAKSEEYCRLATDAATKAVAAMVVNGADFDTAFEANLNANINNELMGQVQNNFSAKAQTSSNNNIAVDVAADDTYEADYDGGLPTGNMLATGYEAMDDNYNADSDGGLPSGSLGLTSIEGENGSSVVISSDRSINAGTTALYSSRENLMPKVEDNVQTASTVNKDYDQSGMDRLIASHSPSAPQTEQPPICMAIDPNGLNNTVMMDSIENTIDYIQNTDTGQFISGYFTGSAVGVAPGGFLAAPIVDSVDYPQAFKIGYGLGEASVGAVQFIGAKGGHAAALALDGTIIGLPAGVVVHGASLAAEAEAVGDMATGIRVAYNAATKGDSGNTNIKGTGTRGADETGVNLTNSADDVSEGVDDLDLVVARDSNGVLRTPDGRFAVDDSITQSKLNRPSLRAQTKRTIETNAPRNSQGQFLDEKGKIISDYHYGHITAHENRRIIAAADELGISQSQLNEYVNARPQYFKIEDKTRNLGHIDELPGRDNIDHIIIDMEEFFGMD
jgi:hypothetical protein